MPPKAKLPNPSDLVDLYRSGMTMKQLAHEFSVSEGPIRRRLRECPGFGPQRQGPRVGCVRMMVDTMEIGRLYKQGMSELAIAKKLGVSRDVIRVRLVNTGVTPRNRSEAMKLRWSQIPKEDRVKKMQKLDRSGYISKDDVAVYVALLQVGLEHVDLGHPVPVCQQWPYRIDVAVLEPLPIAVEIQRSGWSANKRPSFSKRAKNILDRGWFLLYVLIQNRPVPLDPVAVAKYARALTQETSRYDSMIGKYTVVGGDANPVSRIGFKLDGCTFIPPPKC